MHGFDISLANGRREEVGVVRVDTATATIVGSGTSDNYDMDSVCGDRWLSCMVQADGGCPVFAVRNGDGDIIGVEIIVESQAVYQDVLDRCEALGAPRPNNEQLHELGLSRRHGKALDPGSDEQRRQTEAEEAYRRHYETFDRLHSEVSAERYPGLHPAEESNPEIVGRVLCDGQFGVFDPGVDDSWQYADSAPSSFDVTIDVEPGEWDAVIWRAKGHPREPGTRFGLYRRP